MGQFTEIEQSGKAYVYEHWRPDLGVCFWVGKGTTFRFRVFKRNRHYNNIVAKLKAAGLKVEVRFVATHLTDEEAYRIEIERLDLWKSQGVKLANKAAGGKGGMSGITRSAESRRKQSETTTGRKLSEEHRQAIIIHHSDPEYRALVSASQTGRKRPPETGPKISAALKAIGHKPINMNKGTKASEETRAALRAGKTPEVRARLSAATKLQWQNPEYRKVVSDTMKRTNAARAAARAAPEQDSNA
jgi:hypothetical protein